jgi:hypothetical protein
MADGDSEGLEQALADFDELRQELAKVTTDWTIPVLARSYDPGDDGQEDYEDESMIFEEHGYGRSVVREDAALTATYRKTTIGAGSPTTIEAGFCPKCGTAQPEGAAFCPKCGAQLEGPDPETPPQSGDGSSTNAPALGMIAGGITLAVGSLMPWLTATAAFVGTVSRNGIDGGGDGLVTVIAGGCVALGGVARVMRSRWSQIARGLGGLASAVAGVVAVYDIGSVSKRVADLTSGTSGVIASVGVGLYVALIGAAVGLLFSLMPSEADQPAET